MKKYKDFYIPLLLVLLINATLYFLVKYIPTPPHPMSSKIDFPLIKQLVFIYNSWYPFIIITAFIIYKHNKEIYKKTIYTLTISIILTEITYIIYPTIILRPEITIKSFTDLVLHITYKLDTPAINCLPSTHCLFCFILTYFTLKTKELKTSYKILIILYLFLIVISTLLIKQHLLIDVITAFIYMIISVLITKYLYTKLKASKFY